MIKKKENKKDQYLSLKEAAKLSGYSSDYIGYLIRSKRIKGKAVSLGRAWQTTAQAVLNYQSKKNKDKKQAKVLFIDNFFETLRYFLPAILLISIVGISSFFIYASLKEEKKIEIFPTVWSIESNGEIIWLNGQNVLKLGLNEEADFSEFNLENSAGLNLSSQISSEETWEDEETIDEIPNESEKEVPTETGEEMPADEEVLPATDGGTNEEVPSGTENPLPEQTYLQKLLTNLSLFNLSEAWAQEAPDQSLEDATGQACEECQKQEEVIEQTEEETEITEEIELPEVLEEIPLETEEIGEVEETEQTEEPQIILPTVDGEVLEQQETSEQETSDKQQEENIIFTNQASLILSGFSLPENEETFAETKEVKRINVNFSFASQGKELEDDQIIFEWSLDEQSWNNLVTFDQNQEYSNALNAGFFSFSLPDDFDWQEIDNLKIRVSYLTNNNPSERLAVYLDSVWLELTYEEKEEKEAKIKNLSSKNNFNSKEEPEFNFHYTKNEKNILFSAIDSLGELIGTYDFWQDVNLSVEIKRPDDETGFITDSEIQAEISKKDDGDFSIKIKKPEKFRPGLYKIILKIEEQGEIKEFEQDFSWGVLAINVNKSIYLSGEQAYLQMASLDDYGHTICNSNLSLEITSSDDTKAFPEVQQSGQCLPNNVVDVPDYFAYYQTNEIGSYQIRLTNLDNGYEILDSFEVQESVPFEVERIGPTRIWPLAAYEMKMKIKANQDFQGQVIESAPSSFQITGQIIWDVQWQAGETYELQYQFDAPDVSPYIYFLGPVEFRVDSCPDSRCLVFKELRSWQIASDFITTYSPGSETGSWTNPTNAYADSGGYASITSGTPSATHTYGNYGISLPSSSVISQVRVRMDAWTAGTASTISLRSGSQSGNGTTDGSGNFTVNKPSTIVDGDYVICIAGRDDETVGLITPPVDWTSYENAGTSTGNDISVVIAYKYITNAAGETNYTFATGDASEEYEYWIGAFSGISSSNPEDVDFTNGWTNIQNPASPYTFTAPEITTNTDGAYVFAMAYVDSDSSMNNPNSPWATLWDSATTNCLLISSQTDAVHGLTGNADFTSAGVGDDGYVGQFAFRPVITYDEKIRMDVSWDGGSTWSASKYEQTLTGTEATYWKDVTSDTSWTYEKLNNTNFKVRVDAYTVGDASEVRLDWLPVEVTYLSDQSSSSSPTAYSFQRKTWYDGTRYWKAFNDGSAIQFWYSTDGTSWSYNSSATISVATNDFSIEADSSYAFIAYTDGYSVKTSSANSYPNTNFSWSTATTPYVGFSSSWQYYYPTISKDTNNKLRVNVTLKIEPIDEITCNSLSGWHWFTTNGRSACWSKTLADSVSWKKAADNYTDNPGAFTCATGYTLVQRMAAAASGEWYKIVSSVNSRDITSSDNGSAGWPYISALAIADCVDGIKDLCTGDNCIGATDWSSCNSYYRTWAGASGKSGLPYLSTDAGTTQATNDYWDACDQSGTEDQTLGCSSGSNYFYLNRKACDDGDTNDSWAAACGNLSWPIYARGLGNNSCSNQDTIGTLSTSNVHSFRVVVRP